MLLFELSPHNTTTRERSLKLSPSKAKLGETDAGSPGYTIYRYPAGAHPMPLLQ